MMEITEETDKVVWDKLTENWETHVCQLGPAGRF